MLKIINVTFLTIYCSLIFWLSSKSVLPTPMLFIHQDKLHHLGAYFIMGVLAWRFFNDYLQKPWLVFLLSLCFCSLYGGSDEFHQSYVPNREADVLDWMADTLGALMALITIHLTKKRFNFERQAS